MIKNIKKIPQRAFFEFEGNSFARISTCQITIYSKRKNSIVIVTELKNKGTSAINRIEVVAKGVIEKYYLDPNNTTFISHCPPDWMSRIEEFNRVTIEWNGKEFQIIKGSGHWPPLSRNEVEALID